MDNLIGQSIGRYHIIEQLGQGGMATVYKAYDTRLERDVAVKIIRTDQFPPATLEKVLKRFEREAKALARLSHSNIVSVIDYGEQEDVPYLVMTYLPGGTLKEKIKGRIHWAEAARLLLPVAQALAYAHQQGVIHRDVKPNNILVSHSGAPMLTDFGIAKMLDLSEAQTLTGTGVGIGTPEYMAPEQGLGREVDGRADIYSLAIIFYELITGRKPYTADTPMAVVFKHISDPLPRPGEYVPGLPEQVEKVLFKALAKKPEDRYESMDGFIQALDTCLIESPIREKSLLQSLPNAPLEAEKTFDQIPALPKKAFIGNYWWFMGLAFILIAGAGYVFFQPKTQIAAPAQISATQTTSTATPQPQISPTPAESTTPIETKEEELVRLCGATMIQPILESNNIVFFNDFLSSMYGLENWGADAKLSDGKVVVTSHNFDWKAIGRPDKTTPGKGLLIRFRNTSSNQFHIYFEQPRYGQASHRVWGIAGTDGILEPEAIAGADYASQAIDWRKNLLVPTTDWLCAYLAIDNTTFSSQVWNAGNPDEQAFASKDMGPSWANFAGASAFASLKGTLEVDLFSELARK